VFNDFRGGEVKINELMDIRIDEMKLEVEALNQNIIDLEEQKKQQKTGIEAWVDYAFESSSGLTEEFKSFYHDIRKFLKKELKEEFELVFSRGHFEFSGFAKNKVTNKWAYFSSSDVRHFNNSWFE